MAPRVTSAHKILTGNVSLHAVGLSPSYSADVVDPGALISTQFTGTYGY